MCPRAGRACACSAQCCGEGTQRRPRERAEQRAAATSASAAAAKQAPQHAATAAARAARAAVCVRVARGRARQHSASFSAAARGESGTGRRAARRVRRSAHLGRIGRLAARCTTAGRTKAGRTKPSCVARSVSSACQLPFSKAATARALCTACCGAAGRRAWRRTRTGARLRQQRGAAVAVRRQVGAERSMRLACFLPAPAAPIQRRHAPARLAALHRTRRRRPAAARGGAGACGGAAACAALPAAPPARTLARASARGATPRVAMHSSAAPSRRRRPHSPRRARKLSALSFLAPLHGPWRPLRRVLCRCFMFVCAALSRVCCCALFRRLRRARRGTGAARFGTRATRTARRRSSTGTRTTRRWRSCCWCVLTWRRVVKRRQHARDADQP